MSCDQPRAADRDAGPIRIVPVSWTRLRISSVNAEARSHFRPEGNGSADGRIHQPASTGRRTGVGEPPVPLWGPEHERPTLGSAVIELDVILLHEAVAAMEVEPCLARWRVRPGIKAIAPRSTASARPASRSAALRSSCALVERTATSASVLDRLERADRLAELVALADGRESRRHPTQADERTAQRAPFERARL